MLHWRSLLRLLPALSLVLSSLGSPLAADDPVPVPGTLMELQEVRYTPMKEWNDRFTDKIKTDLGARAADFTAFGPQLVFRQMVQAYMADAVPSMGLKYSSVDSHGHPRIYSGRLFLPSRPPGSAPTRVPLVMYMHGTETRKAYVPYNNGGDETMLGALGAEASGFAVAMPDGDGMGADPSRERHAYCHGITTAKCLIDMIRAILGSGGQIFDGINYVWDGRLFIMGYSEGGYIALAAVKELGTNPAYRDLKLTGAACMGGPFDFANFTKGLLKAGAAPYDRPYIPGYLLATWQDLYPQAVTFRDAINPALLGSAARVANVDNGSAAQWLDGVLGGDQITPMMQARLTGDKNTQVSARAITNEAWAKAHVDAERSPVSQLLEANSLVGNWVPHVPVLLVHDPYDECVAFFNSKSIYDSWTRQGAQPMGIVELAVGKRGSGHVGGAVLAVPTAFTWFKTGMPTSLMSMAASTLKDRALAALPPGLAEVINKAAILAAQEQNNNRAEFPVSQVSYRPKGQAGPWTLSLADKLYSVGKVKVYTLTQFPQFAGQQPVPGVGHYTKFVTQLKSRGDSCPINPNEPCYIAVYPEKGAVALTLGFSGMTAGGMKSGLVNIKQVKNKVLSSSSAAFDGDSGFLQANVHTASFENPKDPVPFVTIPQ